MNLLQTIKNIHERSSLSWLDFGLLCLFFLSYSFGQLGRIEIGSATVYFHDFAIVAWLFVRKDRVFPLVKQLLTNLKFKNWWSFAAFIFWVSLGMTVAAVQAASLTPWLYLARLVFYSIFIFSLFSQESKFRLVVKILFVCSGMYMVWFGLLQYLLIPDSRYLWLFGWDEHYYRLIGPLFDPNLSGILFVIIGWVVATMRHILPKSLWLSLFVLVGTAIILTYSRATYVALIVSACFFFATKIKQLSLQKVLVVGAVILTVGLIYLAAPKPGGDGVNLLRTTSIQARVDATKEYFSSLESHQWVIGTGFYTPLALTDNTSHAQVPDNLIVLLVVQTGIVGSALFLIFFAQTLQHITKWEREVQAAFLAAIIHSQFNNSLLEPFIFLALGIALISQLDQKKLKDRTPR